jgi:hypothetical protein
MDFVVLLSCKKGEFMTMLTSLVHLFPNTCFTVRLLCDSVPGFLFFLGMIRIIPLPWRQNRVYIPHMPIQALDCPGLPVPEIRSDPQAHDFGCALGGVCGENSVPVQKACSGFFTP